MRVLFEQTEIQFGVCSVSYNSLHGIPRNETHCGSFSTVAGLIETKFWMI